MKGISISTSEGSPTPPLDLERFQGYLRVLARMGLEQGLRGKVDPSDIVQQTLLEAHQSRALFKGTTAAEQVAWLRQILVQNLVDAARFLKRGKRDVGRERSLDAALSESSTRLGAWLIAAQSSPSEHVAREERVLLLAEALASLPEAEQEALLLRHCRGLTLVEIGEQLSLSRNAVARLLHRGVVSLREKLKDLE